jgi:hypothetical protein
MAQGSGGGFHARYKSSKYKSDEVHTPGHSPSASGRSKDNSRSEQHGYTQLSDADAQPHTPPRSASAPPSAAVTPAGDGRVVDPQPLLAQGTPPHQPLSTHQQAVSAAYSTTPPGVGVPAAPSLPATPESANAGAITVVRARDVAEKLNFDEEVGSRNSNSAAASADAGAHALLGTPVSSSRPAARAHTDADLPPTGITRRDILWAALPTAAAVAAASVTGGLSLGGWMLLATLATPTASNLRALCASNQQPAGPRYETLDDAPAAPTRCARFLASRARFFVTPVAAAAATAVAYYGIKYFGKDVEEEKAQRYAAMTGTALSGMVASGVEVAARRRNTP